MYSGASCLPEVATVMYVFRGVAASLQTHSVRTAMSSPVTRLPGCDSSVERCMLVISLKTIQFSSSPVVGHDLRSVSRSIVLNRQRLDNAEVARDREHLVKTETCAREQRTIFLDRTFHSAGQDHHRDIGDLPQGRDVAIGQC
jgi:hypothetical protein